MSGMNEEKKLLRAEGRAQACEGIMRSQFGQRPSTAGSRALRKLRSSDKGVIRRLWSHYLAFRIAAAAVAATVLVIVLLYALTGSVEPEKPISPDIQAKQQDRPEEPGRLPGRKRGRNFVSPEKDGDFAAKPKDLPREKKPELPEPSHAEEDPDIVKQPEEPPAHEPEKATLLAQIGELSGEVKVKRKGTDEWLNTGVLFSILPGDSVKASSPGQARLDLEGGDCLYLNSDAEITVEEGTDEVLFKLEKGEIYIEKNSVEGTVAVDTGFGHVHSHRGRFHLKRFGKDKYLLHVLEGEVECSEPGRNDSHKYRNRIQAWLHRGKRYEEGREFDSEDEFKWAMKMRRRHRQHERGKFQGPGRHGRPPFPGDRPPIPPGGEEPPKRPPGPRPGEGKHGPGKGGPWRFFKKLVEDFDKLDANGDGKLSFEEVNFPDKEMWNRLVEESDTDRDGGLSLEECKTIHEKIKERKGPPGPGRHGPGGMRGERGGPGNKK
jgi:hypothetical protein